MNAPDAALLRLIDQVESARGSGTPLQIQGGGSKAFYGEPLIGEILDARTLCGISSYEPSELVVTARAGTGLAELEQLLEASGQCLPFEPPRFTAQSTVGGMVAAGLAGPSRASVGSVRDHVLGLTLLNGKAEVLSFGGQVAKNVAGYDVSRLMVGALGILGVICEVSIKVLPVPKATITLRFECRQSEVLERFSGWSSKPLPISASAWCDDVLHLRLSGARAAVEEAHAELGGERLMAEQASDWWQGVRDQRHEFFTAGGTDASLWRLCIPARHPGLNLESTQFIEWQGGLRWCRTTESATAVRQAAIAAGGHATHWQGEAGSTGVFTPVSQALMTIHRNLKSSFDPAGVFNRGRLYAGL
jgi:glycolate oxidase FAD binding subunit